MVYELRFILGLLGIYKNYVRNNDLSQKQIDESIHNLNVILKNLEELEKW